MLRDGAHEAITQARKLQGLSQEALAYRAGVSSRTIADLEKGGRGHHRGTIRKVAKALGLDPADLFDPEEATA